MAYDLATTDRYEIGSAVVTAYPFTLACWFYPDTLTANRTLVDLGSTGGNHGQRIYASSTAVTAQSRSAGADSNASTSAAPSTGQWQHAAGVFASATDRRVFLNGGNKGTNATSCVFNAAIDCTTIGARNRITTYSQGMDGRLCEVAIWKAALADEEILALHDGFSPRLVSPQNLVFYVPLVQMVRDLSRAVSITTTGSPALAAHPRRIA